MKRNRIIELLLFLILIICSSFSYVWVVRNSIHPLLRWSWLLSTLLTLYSFWSYVLTFPSDKEVKNKYKIVAIIPAYNESEGVLYTTIESILRQTVDIKEIHVVDDGSTIAVTPYKHPKVVWHHQENQGKRYAQKRALDHIDKDAIDLILTVDSDSELASDAVEKLLIKLESHPDNQAVTGMILVRNYAKNLMTRIADINIGMSCITARPIRSRFGSLETTSGALSIYRKEIIYNNLDHYVTSGTFSDDRQLCLYSLIEGRAVSCENAIVYTDMPESIRNTYSQRLRWGKGSWKYFPFQLKHLPFDKLIFPLLSMFQILYMPVFYIYLTVISLKHHSLHHVFLFILIRLIFKYVEATAYVYARDRMSTPTKFFTVLLVTPFEFMFSAFALIIIKYLSLLKIRKNTWMTR